jgi:hypothetical protein
MNAKVIQRSLATTALLMAGLLVSACGGGGGDTSGSSSATSGADPNYAVTNKTFDYKSAKSVSFSNVLSNMKSAVVLPSNISPTKSYVTIYVANGDERTQLAFLTVELYQKLIDGSTSTENMGIEIPLGTTQVKYEIYGEDTTGSAVTASLGSITL